ncbi:MAG: PDZ domain-containing protein [Verrucomicrobiales bacterium]
MSPDHPEPAPPLQPEDIALEASLRGLRPRPASPPFLTHLLAHLECTAFDEAAASSPDSPPMPLDASLLAFESELRALRPLEMDFPTGQRVLRALDLESTAFAPPTLTALPGTGRPRQPTRWSATMPWAAAAALVVAGWIALPHLPRPGGTIASSVDSGLIPVVPPDGGKGSVAIVFPVAPRNQVFSSPGGQPISVDHTGRPAVRSVSIPEATPLFGLLDVEGYDLPPEFLQSAGIAEGVGIHRVGPGGPAHTHGLMDGDIILRINGAPVDSVDSLSVMVRNSRPGATVSLRILRGRDIFDLPVRLGAAPTA